MFRNARFAAIALSALIAALLVPAVADGQARGRRRPPEPVPRAVAVPGHVFIGGYFYDPFFGPYPWWNRTSYPYWYFPVYDRRSDLRLDVTPDEAAVYVDGFYAGIVDDFDGFFQSLPLPPGGHSIVLFLEGYRTVRHNVYLSPAGTFRLRETMARLPAGVRSEPPDLTIPVPPPPPGSYTLPRTAPPPWAPGPGTASGAVAAAADFATIELRVQPAGAEVSIDGQRWLSSDDQHLSVRVPPGTHRVEVTRTGFRKFAADVDVRPGETKTLNVSLATTVP